VSRRVTRRAIFNEGLKSSYPQKKYPEGVTGEEHFSAIGTKKGTTRISCGCLIQHGKKAVYHENFRKVRLRGGKNLDKPKGELNKDDSKAAITLLKPGGTFNGGPLDKKNRCRRK